MIGILLAAGFSRRFGDMDKLMYPLNNGTPIAVAAAQNMVSALPNTIIVTRHGNEALHAALVHTNAHLITCSENETDMSDSLALAVRYSARLKESEHGFVIGLADMPFISVATIQAIAQKLSEGAAIVVPTYVDPASQEVKRGHPVGFAARFRAELEAVQGDVGAKEVLFRHKNEIVFLLTNDLGITQDIDTKADLI
jgi:molybdenum cofactor cytidylyltransferase